MEFTSGIVQVHNGPFESHATRTLMAPVLAV